MRRTALLTVALEKMPLIEVQFKVRGCVESEAEQFLRERFGPPDVKQSKGALTVWQNPFMWVGAFIPSEPGRCLIHFLPMSEAAEIERIKAKADGSVTLTGMQTSDADTAAGSSRGNAATGSAAGSASGNAATGTAAGSASGSSAGSASGSAGSAQ